MCTYIAEIKASYREVKKETSRIARKSYENPVDTLKEDNIDEFLDAINIITRDLNSVTQSTNELIRIVRNNFSELSKEEAKELLGLSHPILNKMQLLHTKLIASPLYRGMTTSVELYSDAMSDFEELCQDLQTFRVELNQNEDYQRTLQQLNEMLKI